MIEVTMLKSSVLLAVLLVVANGADEQRRAHETVTTLMQWYNQGSGLWDTTGWWNGANVLTSVVDYMLITGNRDYVNQIENSFAQTAHQPNTDQWTNDFIDDSGWWGLAWIRAYDLINDRKYLQAAQHVSDFMYSYSDSLCNGGLYWNKEKKYKNAITNELFIKLAASVYNRNGDQKYLDQAKEVWNWLNNSGMINGDRLIEDGLNNQQECKATGQTYTYNQGVVLGGLVELYRATNDQGYLDAARNLADGSTESEKLNPNGILREPGEGDSCSGDGPTFKGVYARNLGELNRALAGRPYQAYLERQSDSVYNNDRSDDGHYGNHWAGPFVETTANCQHSALDLFNAGIQA